MPVKISSFIASLLKIDLDYKINSNEMRSRNTIMAIEPQHKIMTDPNTRLIFLVFGLPIAGLIYCGLGIAGMAYFSEIREHPILSGSLFFMIPFSIAASIWIRASAQAYKN